MCEGLKAPFMGGEVEITVVFVDVAITIDKVRF